MKYWKLVIGATLFVSGANALSPAELGEQEEPDHTISITTKDIDLTIDGRVREEFFYLDRASSLRDDCNDTYQFFRNKANLGIFAEYGSRQYGRPAASAQIRLAAFNYWDDATKYTAFSEEPVYVETSAIREKAEISEHTHVGTVPLIYQEEAWFDLDFDVFSSKIKIPISLRVGYFPYKVGRGIALGDYFDGAISYMGWQTPSTSSNASNSPAGILWEIDFTEEIGLDFYYSKWRASSIGPDHTRNPIRAHWMSVTFSDRNPSDAERGTKSDADLFAAKCDIDLKREDGGEWHIEPYTTYVYHPDQKIEFAGDATTQLGTAGFMAEYSGEQFSFNVECAMQYGFQKVRAIDRAVASVERHHDGTLQSVYKGIVLGNLADSTQTSNGVLYSLADGAWVTDALKDAVFLPINRDAEKNGAAIVTANGDALKIGSSSDINVYNGSLPFGGNARFRPEYNLSFGGIMALFDAQYTLKSKRARIGVAVALISGDEYPYNLEIDKKYRGFIPMRDQNYFGHFVRSFAMLYARAIPRPVDMSDYKLYAYNNDESVSNLRYVGIGAQWHPLKDPRELIIMPCAFLFWEDRPPHRWYPHGSRQFTDTRISTWYQLAQGKVNFTGAASDEFANSFLGAEFSLSCIWNVLNNFEVASIFSAFLPGRLYQDVKGMPNRNTRRFEPSGKLAYESLGTEAVLGGTIRMTYRF